MSKTIFDAVIVGAGPNGLTAAAVLSAAGLSVLVLEAKPTIGGSCSTQGLSLPGFSHDVCAAIHPMGVASPAFRHLELDRHGLQWVSAPNALAHPLDDGRVALLGRTFASTDTTLESDGRVWSRLMKPFVEVHEELFAEILRPLRIPAHPWLMARFARLGLRSAANVVRYFAEPPARALFAGCAAHSFLPLDAPGSAAFGLILGIAAHALDWPCARGGSQQIVEALSARAQADGCEIRTNSPVRSAADLPSSRAVLFDVTPRQLEAIAAHHLSATYRRRLRKFQYGPGAFKIDYALSEPVPWRSPACRSAATVHLGGTYEEIARSESIANNGGANDKPFVLFAQQSLFDTTRAPAGQHTGWAYCHVPNGSALDMTDRIEQQIERFAPGFRDVILARRVLPPAALEMHNANLIGGDIGGGANTLRQVLWRPFPRWDPYTTSNPRFYLCSSSTPPGSGVHGMCGYWAARSVLHRVFGRSMASGLGF